jgi:hypothetical protein
MRLVLLRRGLLAGAALLAACATTRVSDQKLAQLPVDERAQIVTAQQSINVAQQNLAAAKVANEQARRFRKVAHDEIAAANSRLSAARTSIDLSRQSRDSAALANAQHNEDLARQQLLVARAKSDYADRLIELREARVDEGEAQVAAARADVELQKAQRLLAHELDPGVEVNRLERDRQDAQERLAERRAKVAALQGEAAQLKMAWDDRRDEARTASRSDVRDVPPPLAPAPLPMPNDPRGEVNDTPSAPANPSPAQEEPSGPEIAPAP